MTLTTLVFKSTTQNNEKELKKAYEEKKKADLYEDLSKVF